MTAEGFVGICGEVMEIILKLLLVEVEFLGVLVVQLYKFAKNQFKFVICMSSKNF